MGAIYLQNSAAADFKKHGKAIANNYGLSSYSSSFHGQNNIYNGHVLYASPFPHQYYSSSPPVNRGQQQKQNQPPLLPLPKPYQNSRSRKLNTTTNHQSLSVKKFSSSSSVREKSKHQSMQVFSSNLIAINRLGPDPTDVPRVLFSNRSDVVNNISKDNNYDLVTKFSGSIVSTVRSPPPSSLPLPTFSLRPKGCCNTEAAVVAGVDAGATNNLRRILRL